MLAPEVIHMQELPSLVQDQGIDTSRLSISGHSMGGHGALTIGLKNPVRGDVLVLSALCVMSAPGAGAGADAAASCDP